LFGPLRLWLTGDVAWKNTYKTLLKPTINFALKDLFDFGVGAEYDLNALTALNVILKKRIASDKNVKSVFLKYDVKEHKFGLGADYRCIEKDATFGLDVTFDASDAKPEHFLGKPIVAQFQLAAKMSDNISTNYVLKLDKDISHRASVTQKFDDKLRLVTSGECNLSKTFKDPKKCIFNWGCLVEYSL